MSTPDQIQRRQQDRHIKMLETLRRLRRDRAEAAVATAREEESKCRGEHTTAIAARRDASARLEQWNSCITEDAYMQRARMNAAMSQPIFEFNELTSQIRRREFAEFAAERRELLATQKLDSEVVLAKAAAVSHEKIIECRK